MEKKLNIKNIEVVELTKEEGLLTNGGSWLSWAVGYFCGKAHKVSENDPRPYGMY